MRPCVAVLIIGLGLLLFSGRKAEGVQLGVAAVIFALAPVLTLGGAAIVIWNLDGKALGAAAFLFLGVLPSVPLLGAWWGGAC